MLLTPPPIFSKALLYHPARDILSTNHKKPWRRRCFRAVFRNLHNFCSFRLRIPSASQIAKSNTVFLNVKKHLELSKAKCIAHGKKKRAMLNTFAHCPQILQLKLNPQNLREAGWRLPHSIICANQPFETGRFNV